MLQQRVDQSDDEEGVTQSLKAKDEFWRPEQLTVALLDVKESDPRCTHQEIIIKELGFYDHMAAEKQNRKEVTVLHVNILDNKWN